MPKKIFISTKTSNSLDPQDIQYISFEFSKIIAEKIKNDEILSKEFEVILADPANIDQTGINYWDYCSTSVKTSDFFVLVILDKEALLPSKNPLPEFPDEKTNYIEKESLLFYQKYNSDKTEIEKRLFVIVSNEIKSEEVKNIQPGLPTLKHFLTAYTKLPPIYDKNETSKIKQEDNQSLIVKNLLTNLQNRITNKSNDTNNNSKNEFWDELKIQFDSDEKLDYIKGKIQLLVDEQYKNEAQTEQILDDQKIIESLMYCGNFTLNELQISEKRNQFLNHYFDLLPRYKKNEIPVEMKINKFKKFIESYIKSFTSVLEYLKLNAPQLNFTAQLLDKEIEKFFNERKMFINKEQQAKKVFRPFREWFKNKESKIKEVYEINQKLKTIFTVEVKVNYLFFFQFPFVNKYFLSEEFRKIITFDTLKKKNNPVLKEFCVKINEAEKNDEAADYNSLLFFKRLALRKKILGSSSTTIRVINLFKFFS